MNLSADLISQFTKTVNADRSKKEVTTYGTIVDSGGTNFVQLDGSDLLTPMETTVEVNPDDRVIVNVRNHIATVVGNTTDPSIGIKRAGALESGIVQTAEQIMLYVKDEDAKLQSSITLIASEIRSEVSDEVNKLSSTISQTAGEIRAEISDEVNKLETKITVNTEGIETLVSNQDEFSKFQQTVEGFTFMNKGGTVKLSGGDITLTGAIKWADLASDVKGEIDDANTTANSAKTVADSAKSIANTAQTAANNAKSTADSAYYRAGTAITQAETAEAVAGEAKLLASQMSLPSYLTSTYIDSTLIMSPTIVGGVFYAIGESSWLVMTGYGLEIYTDDISEPKVIIENKNEQITLVLGAGTTSGKSRFYIDKRTNGASIMYNTTNNNFCGFYFNDDGTIVTEGTLIS